ncbi:Transmembrane channel-like protein 8 [Dissostichus eleginoides]|uniref:Transmembrane channel-like protein 8 n=1 Tax=Dissostichus eleginoides TaxID=100907 RepID=A0AAD9FP21_DISEL|nr:Transmembrane channel-like protein 8 [Dissostichus eleginoides]
MLEHETGADMRLVRQISAGMKIQAAGEHMGCSKVGENTENQVICVQCQEEVVRVCPGSPGSPRRAIATRLSSGSADREPSSSSYNASSGTFYSCVSQITIGAADRT